MSPKNNKRPALLGMHHIALWVEAFEKTVYFYHETLGMAIEWQPDEDNIYLCSGSDNLALHRYKGQPREELAQRLDHLGFILATPEIVDVWHAYLHEQGVKIKNTPKVHRDGAKSFYCLDPDGNHVQFIYHPPLDPRRDIQDA